MITIKKISKSGSITIPATLRRKLGIVAGDTFKIEESSDGLVFKRNYGHCIFCVTDTGIKYFKKIAICEVCKNEINKEAN